MNAAAGAAPRTAFDKIWDQHVVRDLGDGWVLLHIDRHLLHDLSGPAAIANVMERGLPVRNPELVFATPDHAVSSSVGRTGLTFPPGARLWRMLKELTGQTGIELFDLGDQRQGIVHVIGPELGLVLPGLTLICGDSHTCTNGGLGALAFGVGTSESSHALATSTLRQRKPRRMRVRLEGQRGAGVTAKDVVLHLIGKLGASAGIEHAIEFAGAGVRAMSVEERLTLCNLSVEFGARSGMVSADDITFNYLHGRPYAPKGAEFDAAVAHWRGLATDDGARFDKDELLDIGSVAPTITWGTSPEQTISVDELVPDPARLGDPAKAAAARQALDYMGLEPGKPLLGQPVDRVFIGSCTNSRLSDLRDAAAILKGRRVSKTVEAWVVPGSMKVKADAEAEGLDAVFRDAGFQWREPGCSMCVAANGEQAAPGSRVVSTSNRNFVGRQGPNVRTHLASPAMAAAAAIAGRIADVRLI